MGQRMILLNDFARQWEDTRDKALAAFGAVGESGWYVLGQQLRDFEVALAQFWGVRNCVGVASGLDAIEISLRSLGCKPGDKVLTTPLSAFATTLAILKIGAVPIFVIRTILVCWIWICAVKCSKGDPTSDSCCLSICTAMRLI